MIRIGLLSLAFATSTLLAAEPASLPAGYKLLFEQSFDKPDSVKDVVFRDPVVWKHVAADSGGYLELAYDPKKYKIPDPPKHRSPFHMAMIKDKVFGDFVMDLEMASTIKPYPHQDMCLFFGYESPEKFYYTHVAVRPDDHAHNVFIVNDAPRIKISKETTPGVVWDVEKWHKLRLVREGSTGKIEVYFDDMTKPIMHAEDKTFPKGFIGFGSFDDHGRIRNVKVYGSAMEEKKNKFMKPLNP